MSTAVRRWLPWAIVWLCGIAQAQQAPALAPAEQWVNPAALHEAAAQALMRTWSGRFDALEVTPATGGRGLVVPAGPIEVTARAPDAEAWPRARQTVWVDVRQGGATVRSALVKLTVQAQQQGWIAVTDMPAGARLASTLLREEPVDVARAGQPVWQGPVEGWALKTPLRAGQPLVAAQVEKAPTVARGERVVLNHRAGALVMTASAEALQAGAIGQAIQVRVDSARGAVLARVTGNGEVELLP